MDKLGKNINRLLLKIANKFKILNIPALPIHLDIEPINICNFSCKHCKVTYWNKNKVSLTFDNFLIIINQFPNLQSVKLQGLGEPLLNKEFHYFIKECAKRNIHVEFFTNGSVKNNEVWNLVNMTKKISVSFSIDSANQTTFEKIRSGSNFYSVIENIKEIIKENEKKYSFWTVVSKQNYKELLEIILLAKKIGIRRIVFQTFLSDWKSKSIEKYTSKIKYNNSLDEFKQIKTKCIALAKELDINLNFYDGNYLSKKNKCSWPFTSTFIASNGDVVPCCVISDSDVIKMGNLFEKPFSEIWNSTKYKKFRLSIKKHQLNEFCKSCYNEK